jgi:predicted metal-dependent phosphoesterase TrpH
MLIDMHIHTHFSPCSIIKIPQLLQRAKKVGIDGICITDHNSIASKSVLEKIADYSGLFVIVGVEYTTSYGDFLVYGPVDYIPEKMDARNLFKWVQKEGGVTIAAHPFRKDRPVDPDVLHLSKIIESVNGRNNPAENALCKNWIKKHGNEVKEIGGSDAHTVEEIGQVVTVFKRNIYTMDDLIIELLGGNYSPLKRNP